MSPYEQRRRGNALPGGLRGHPRRGNTSKGQRGSRHLADIGATSVGTLSSIQPVRVCARVEPSSKPGRSGVYAGQSLSFGLSGKARWGKAKVANRTREIRPSGMKAGARGNVAHGGTVNPPRNRKGGDGNPPPKSARAPVLSRPVLVAHTKVEGSAAELCRTYRAKNVVENDFHVIKSLVKLRPVRHRTDAKVRAHVALCMLALYVQRELTLKLKKDDVSAELAFEHLETSHVDVYSRRGVQGDAYVVPLPTREQTRVLRRLGLTRLVDQREVGLALRPRSEFASTADEQVA
jgi:hypothetical protein